MVSVLEMTEIAVRHGRVKKRNNAVAAILCGVVPAILFGFRFSVS